MIEIDLRPTDMKRRAAGTARLAILIHASERLARIALPIVVAVAYLRFSTTAISITQQARLAELRALSDGAIESVRKQRQEAKNKIKARQARERARALDTLFDALERTSIPEVSLIELSASGDSVLVKGEVADIPTLHSFLSELRRRVEGVEMAVESTGERVLNDQERHHRFNVRILLAGHFREVRGARDLA